jgi:predicted nucleic acid-binding protein
VITPALLCDTGALLDYLNGAAADHRAFRAAIDQARTRYVPGLVLAELDYFLRDNRPAMRAFMSDLDHGAFTYAAPSAAILWRAMQIDEQFKDLGLGLVDASVAALAEELGVTRLVTRDVRDFSAIRLRGGRAFEIVVAPTNPDRATKRPRAPTK